MGPGAATRPHRLAPRRRPGRGGDGGRRHGRRRGIRSHAGAAVAGGQASQTAQAPHGSGARP
ncbi:hypothetical protein EYW49_05905 [Siculibacillus lacustris]|uniref:Uncharacterized protein n=1 Tax=Siculibacillus lacustris TaxID=1549641 RepID=A0A4Q9VUK8_9HYPH|nr:hypothetical protein EYW49_05905 [Siculibacillus lacustris]